MIGRGRATVAGLVGLALLGAGCRLPTLKQEEARSRTLPQTSFVYAADGSLEYLFGFHHLDHGKETFTPFWAHDRAS